MSQVPLNKGVQIMLGGGKKAPDKPKSFQVKFGNMLRFFKRELHLYFEFSLDIKKDTTED